MGRGGAGGDTEEKERGIERGKDPDPDMGEITFRISGEPKNAEDLRAGGSNKVSRLIKEGFPEEG